MNASKNRPRWDDLPSTARAAVEKLVGGSVRAAHSCPGGFSPGFASRLVLADGGRCFVKAMDAVAWPGEAAFHRAEARVNAVLSADVPAPRLLGTSDGDWTILAFEDVAGAEPAQPWHADELARVVATVADRLREPAPRVAGLSGEHPRLGGWAELAGDEDALADLRQRAPWAAERLASLVSLEADGLALAHGDALVHFDLYPHNILLTPERVFFVDWPHARLGAGIIDLVMLLSSAAADGIDPEPILRRQVPPALAPARTVDAILAAHAGFLLRGGLSAMPPGLEPIAAAKLRLGLGAAHWLRRRLTGEPW